MDDLISRQEALEAINRIWDKCEEIEAHLPDGDPDKTGYKMIEDYLTVWKYLSAQPEQQWIPCSERLPEKDGRYQVTRHDYVTNTEFIDILWYEKNQW